MRYESGRTDQYLYFVAVDATDLKTRETGLSSFTVVRSRNGAADATYTTPTVSEVDAATMPGVYALLLDEDTTVANGALTEEVALHITHGSMAAVTRTFELFREPGLSGLKTAQAAAAGSLTMQAASITADSQKLGVAYVIEESTGAAGAIGQIRSAIATTTATQIATLDYAFDTTPSGTIKYREIAGTLGLTATEIEGELLDNLASLATAIQEVEDKVDTVDTVVDAILVDTATLPSDPADASVVAGLIAAVEAKVDTVDTIVDAIKLSTDALPSDPADASVVAGLIAASDAKIDTLLTSDVTIKKAVALTALPFPMRTTAGDPATGVTVTMEISKNGGAFAGTGGAVTEISGGWYKVDLTGTETNCDWLAFKATGASCAQQDFMVRTQA